MGEKELLEKIRSVVGQATGEIEQVEGSNFGEPSEMHTLLVGGAVARFALKQIENLLGGLEFGEETDPNELDELDESM